MTPLSKRLLVLLVISGALNLLGLGLFVGSALHRSRLRAEHGRFEAGPRGPHAGDTPGRGGPPDAGREPRRGRGPFAGVFAGHREELQAHRRATAEARRAVAASLAAEPFDAAALEQALTRVRAETQATQELIHRALLETAQSGDADARRKLARGFERLGPPL